MKKQALLALGTVSFLSLFLSACLPKTKPIQAPQSQQPSHDSAHDSMNHQMTVKDEKDFLNQMIPHHQEAIDTSKIIAEKSTDAELKKFAQGVITVQTAEISQMEQWLSSWYQEKYQVNTTYQPMMGDLTVLGGKELEKAYIQGMIVHHQGAIEMAKQVSALNPRTEIKKMANDIVTVQTAEVATLQKWLGSK